MQKPGMLSLMDTAIRDLWFNCLEKDDIPEAREANILSPFEQLHLNNNKVF
ncbi:DUF4942 domain-containing protein [Lelliottia amnigena]|uniref:DUF4942 domain-containing protein n=1 Tax=Lelliottia amnigena TaxID=61646 RepID=UPI001ED900A6|nr:DUF4942 domain-containing protein [Lelliottia amnigena]